MSYTAYNSKVILPQGSDVLAVDGAGGGKITPISGTQASHISNIGNSATGTEIATAVNAIIAAIQAIGITASS